MNIAAMTDDEWKARREVELALRRCPFCGYEVGFVNFDADDLQGTAREWIEPGVGIECVDEKCFAYGTLKTWPTYQAAAKAWNKRGGR